MYFQLKSSRNSLTAPSISVICYRSQTGFRNQMVRHNVLLFYPILSVLRQHHSTVIQSNNLTAEETLHDPIIFYIFGRGKLRPRKFCTEARKSTNGSQVLILHFSVNISGLTCSNTHSCSLHTKFIIFWRDLKPNRAP